MRTRATLGPAIAVPILAVVAVFVSGCMWGVVRDAGTGAGIEGATVQYVDSQGNTGSTTTTAFGLYFFNASIGFPAIGPAQLNVSAPGYATLSTTRPILYDDNPNATLADLSTFWEVQSFDLATGTGAGIISSLASGLHFPVGAVYDGDGNLYVSERDTCSIRRISRSGHIATIAGDGTCGFSGDGGDATDAELSAPSGLAIAPNGDIVVAENGDCRVRRIDMATGTISTVAGNGTCGFSGDGGDATLAQLGLADAAVPSTFVWSDVAFDSAGNLYVADIFNCRIREVVGGTISTIAGSGPTGFTCGEFSGDGGPATSARLNQPSGVAVNADGEVFIGELGGCRVRKVSRTRSHTIETIAGGSVCASSGNGGSAVSAGLANVRGLALDADGNVYISQFRFNSSNPMQMLDCEVRRIDDSDGKIRRVAGNGVCGFSGDDGAAISAQIDVPGGLALACNGDIAVTDAVDGRARVVKDVNDGGPAPGDVCP
ncbi:MAG: carboxypeptidase regulatory-like domain-containing protein [Dehalococcoidia bacterium]